MPSSWANTRICNLLQPLYNKNKHERILRIIEEFSTTKDIGWALLDDDKLSSSQQRALLTAWKHYFAHISSSAGDNHLRPINKADSRILLRGVSLHDGTILSIIGNRILLDGVELPGNFPVEALAKAMTRRAKHGLPPTSFNWPLLIPTMSVLVEDGNMKLRDRSTTAFARLIHAPENAFRATVLNNQSDRRITMNHNALVGVMGWLNWRQPQMSKDMVRPLIRTQNPYHPGITGFTKILTGFQVHGKDWLQGSEPWVERWRRIDAEGVELVSERRSAFCMRNGALILRVLSESGSWVRTNLPHDPRLWALLSSWTLSPPQSRAHNMFMSLRWNWKNPRPEMNLPEPEVKALTLLRSICVNNRDKVLIHNRKIMVHGRSGCAYGIDTKEGVHRAPFTIKAWPTPTSQSLGEEGQHLCIHTGTERRKLPLGDVIASVVLTLLDDTASAHRIDSLQQFIAGVHDPARARRYRPRRNHPLGDNLEWRQYYRQQRQNLGQIREYWRINADAWPDAQIRDADGQVRDIEVRVNANVDANVGIQIEGANEVFVRDPNLNANDNNNGNNEGNNARGGIAFEVLRNYFPNREGAAEADGEEDNAEPQQEASGIGQFGGVDPFGVGQNAAAHGEDAERIDDLVLNEVAFRELENNGHLQAGPAGVRTPRWTTLFPLLSRIFQAMPQGEEVRLPRVNGGLLQFESCGFQINIHSEQEIGFVNSLAELMGWGRIRAEQEDDVHDEAQNTATAWVREQAPNQDALAQITRLLRPLQQELGQRAEAPWWWSFRRISENIPEQLDLTWDMELSYADIGDDHADLIA